MSYPNPDKLPKHKFPQSLLKQIEENGDIYGSFFLLTRDSAGEFVVVPNFKNNPDKIAYLSFMNTWSQIMLENSAISMDNEISSEMFGDDDD